MSIDLKGNIPAIVLAVLGCNSNTYEDTGILISTVDENEFPHFAILSPFQVVLTISGDLYISTYSHSTTTKNLLERRKGSLAVVVPPSIFYISAEFDLLSVDDFNEDFHNHLIFHGALYSILKDESEDAPITSPIRYESAKIRERYIKEHNALCRAVSTLRSNP